MDNITIIRVKALAKQSCIKGYYKIREAELIQKCEAHPDVNEQIFITGVRNTQKHNDISKYQRNS